MEASARNQSNVQCINKRIDQVISNMGGFRLAVGRFGYSFVVQRPCPMRFFLIGFTLPSHIQNLIMMIYKSRTSAMVLCFTLAVSSFSSREKEGPGPLLPPPDIVRRRVLSSGEHNTKRRESRRRRAGVARKQNKQRAGRRPRKKDA